MKLIWLLSVKYIWCFYHLPVSGVYLWFYRNWKITASWLCISLMKLQAVMSHGLWNLLLLLLWRPQCQPLGYRGNSCSLSLFRFRTRIHEFLPVEFLHSLLLCLSHAFVNLLSLHSLQCTVNKWSVKNVLLKYMYIDTVKFAVSVYVGGPRFEH